MQVVIETNILSSLQRSFMDLLRVERELKKRLIYPYRWGRKQSNDWDHNTNFIYTTYSFKKLLQKTASLSQELKDYALNRWYNYWSAMAAEDIFAQHDNVKANKNIYDKLVDFTIDDIPFDHKTSIFPNGFNKDITYAKRNEKELINWLYENQSQQGRKHLKNRLFIVLYDNNREHWKMKSEIMVMKEKIDRYMRLFDKGKLKYFTFDDEKILSDIIWIER